MKKVLIGIICVFLIAIIGAGMVDRVNRTIIVKNNKAMENGYVVYSWDCTGLTKIHQTTKVVDNVHGDIQRFDHEINLIEFIRRVNYLNNIEAV